MSGAQAGTDTVLRAVYLSIFALVFSAAGLSHGAKLSDPEVDHYNLRVGTQTFSGLYQFTTNTLLLETAQAIQDMGSDTIKLYLGYDYVKQYHQTLPSNITNLL